MHRLLILAPTFFPDPAVSGIRVTQWAKHLPEFGWTPLVLCRHHGHTATAEALAARVHRAVQVEYLGPRVPASHPERSGGAAGSWKSELKSRLVRQVIAPLAVPDPLIWKWKSFRQQAIEIARRWQPDVVLSSSPPHSIHWLGRAVAQAVDVPWVADFRDPYLIDSRYGLRGVKRLFAWQHQRFERGIYREAELCVHAIPLHGRWARAHYDFARERIRILTNGIPPELLDERLRQSDGSGGASGSQRVSIRAVGVMGSGAIELIAAALRKLLDQGVDVEFRHVGHVRDAGDAARWGLDERFQLRGPVSHAEALREIAGADVLLNYLDAERAKVGGLSSKLFEYLATGRPIVAVNPTRSDRQLIERLPWCRRLDYPKPDTLADALHQAITTRVEPDEGWVDNFRRLYNRRNQAGQLAHWLDELLA